MRKVRKDKGIRTGVWLTCPCGNLFYRWTSKAATSRTCSKECQYKYARRRSGLSYEIIIQNKAWYSPGESRGHRYPKGRIPDNFKGDNVGYDALHDWLKRHYGKATKCEHCSKTQGRICWANKSWEYKRERDDWLQLCAKCHHKYDRNGGWGLATAKFPEMRRER